MILCVCRVICLRYPGSQHGDDDNQTQAGQEDGCRSNDELGALLERRARRAASSPHERSDMRVGTPGVATLTQATLANLAENIALT